MEPRDGFREQAARVARLHGQYLEDQMLLWAELLSGAAGPAPQDRRFDGGDWRDNPYYRYVSQSYLLAARFCNELVEAAPLEARAKERLRFATRQWIDALSPSNFAATNPQVLRRALESRGESLTRGIANLIADAARGRISQTDESAFELGRDLAATRGAVVFENALLQLIQYLPLTTQVARRPLVIVPPCINKYYILDLQPENSFVRHAVAAGHSVFMLSWRNPGQAEARLTWDDYLELGIMQGLSVARQISRAERVNALGYCVGGTQLAAALAVLAARGECVPASVTYLAALHDFSDTGQLGLFVDEPSVAAREAAIGAGGLLPASELDGVFLALRANDLVWPYVINNYLLGESPRAFDLLHWNCDGANLPGPMYCYYLRNLYLENRLRVPGALASRGVPIDLGAVRVPTYLLATQEDHIVPWRSAYRSLRLLGGDKTFVLGASGHVAGVINPPHAARRSFWTHEGPVSQAEAEDPDAWMAGARQHSGSWWPHWLGWLERHSGGRRKAPAQLGNRTYPPLEQAPGRYVKEKAPAVRRTGS